SFVWRAVTRCWLFFLSARRSNCKLETSLGSVEDASLLMMGLEHLSPKKVSGESEIFRRFFRGIVSLRPLVAFQSLDARQIHARKDQLEVRGADRELLRCSFSPRETKDPDFKPFAKKDIAIAIP